MAKEHSPPEIDLDSTDKLPILRDVVFEPDVEDDAVPLDRTASMPGPASFAAGGMQEFTRAPGVDLPSLAESVRSVEERISRQRAEFEALTRAYERALDADSASSQRAGALAVELAAARTALESEQSRSRELDRTLADRSGALEAARSRAEEALRLSERHQSESRTLRDSLAARDAAIVQALRSLGERDAQLTALQTEHAKIVPVLEANSKSTSQLEAELQTVRARATELALELRSSRETAAAREEQFKRGESELKAQIGRSESEFKAQIGRSESELNALRSELDAAKMQATSFLDLLRTREWRRGFDQNMFRELDAQVGAAQAGHGVLESERARLQGRVATLEAQLAEQLAATEIVEARMAAELAARERALAEARERGGGDARRVAQLLEAAELRQAETATQMAQLRSEQAAQVTQLQKAADLRQAEMAAQMAQLRSEQAAQIAQLQSEAETHEQEMTVLMAHLQEARRPIQSIESDVKRLTGELAATSAAGEALEEENRKLRATLERTRGALEEREFLIRRLERSESNNAHVLGRIQTSIERLGSVPAPANAGPAASSAGAAGEPADWSAELIRIDGERPVTHVLSRRTRIGRATGCELQIDSGSVSRHHALIVVGPREAIIEDLNSTNGVLVNGRKVTRQPLCDGDAVTIGETQFRYLARPLHRAAEPKPAETTPTT
jgi:chromosome segregation ATPase